MPSSYDIKITDGAKTLGLPDMLKNLIGQNLTENPQKVVDFLQLRIRIGLMIIDADITITLAFDNGRLTIYPGHRKPVHIFVEAAADILMALSNQTIKWGLPYYFDETGREILTAMKTGRLKARGMLFHLPSMIRFSRVMSVR